MRSRSKVFVALLVSAQGGLLACSNGNNGGPSPSSDAAPEASITTVPDAGWDGTAADAKPEATADATADARADGAQDGSTPSKLLLSYNSYAGMYPGELVAFDVASRSVAGRFEYSGPGTSYVVPAAPWLLEQGVDTVLLLDGAKPWVVDSSWQVSGEVPDGGSYADPQAVIVASPSKAYVLPYLRNAISAIDTSAHVDAGLPVKSIDLSALVQTGGDGLLEMTAGVYVAAQNRVYVLLANVNQGTFNTNTGYLQCAGQAAPTVVAIDVATDSLVALDGGSSGSAIHLPGRNPAFGQGAMAYDPVGDRLLVLQGGCTSTAADGGDGPLLGAEVDSVSLATGTTNVLLDLTGQELPAQLVYVDSAHAFVQVGYGPFTTYAWNPTTSALGSAVPNAPDLFAWDGNGNLVGVTAQHDADSGAVTGYGVVSVRVSDGTVTTLGSNPFSLTGGGPTGAQLWPAP